MQLVAGERPAADPREAAVRRHVLGVWRYLRMLGCSPDQAEDLAQDAFVTALAKGATDRDPAALGSFLRQTARFLFLRSRENARPAATLADAVDLLWARDCADDDGGALVEAVRRCVAELSERASAALRLTYGEDRSRADVARALQMKENGVKTLLQRARRAVRDCVHRRLP
jgi:RNA polymerase sigma-70 factor (ECF subfamily)